jgi:hypothetical protein
LTVANQDWAKRAEQCRQNAATTTNKALRRRLLDMAEQYDAWAAQTPSKATEGAPTKRKD